MFYGIHRCDLPSPRLINRRKLNGTFSLNFFMGQKCSLSRARIFLSFRTFSYLYTSRGIQIPLVEEEIPKKAANIVSAYFDAYFPLYSIRPTDSSYHSFRLSVAKNNEMIGSVALWGVVTQPARIHHRWVYDGSGVLLSVLWRLKSARRNLSGHGCSITWP